MSQRLLTAAALARLDQPLTQTPLVLPQKHATELGEAVRWIVERAEDGFAVWDRERHDSTFLVVGVLENLGSVVEPRVAKAARELENVPVVYRDAGESHGADRTFDRSERVSETSAEPERAGSAFGVPGIPSLLGRWVADPATLLALVARSPA